jgi:hypothetical protein
MATDPTPAWKRLVSALNDADYADLESAPATRAEVADAILELITETVAAALRTRNDTETQL